MLSNKPRTTDLNDQPPDAPKHHASSELVLAGAMIAVDDSICFANHEAAILFRRPRASLLGPTDKLYRDVVHPEDLALLRTRTQRFDRGEAVQNRFEIRIDIDDEVRWLELYFSEIEYEGRAAMLTHFTDVTPRVEARLLERQYADDLEHLSELSLQLVEHPADEELFPLVTEMLGSLSNATYVIMTEISSDDQHLELRHISGIENYSDDIIRLLSRNPVGQNFLIPDESRRRLVQRGMLRHIPGGIHEVSYKQIPIEIARTLEDLLGITSVYAIGFCRKGRLVGSANLLMTGGNRPRARVVEAFGHQISAAMLRHVSEEERQKLTEQLRLAQRLESVGQLAGGVAHEFNNLLTAIDGNVLLALSQLGEDAHIYPMLDDIRRAARRGSSLTGQMLAFSRQQLFTPKVVDLNHIVESMESLLMPVLGERIELDIRCHATPALITADRGQIEQIIMNLALNARDAMLNGGSLTFETSHHTRGEELRGSITLTTTSETTSELDWLKLSAADTGHGMESETQRRMFEPFFTTKPLSEGTGLGMSVVYGIVKRHQGFLTVDSSPAEGTTISAYFPVATEKRAPVTTPPPVYVPHHDSGTILMVEDDLLVRRVNLRLLRQLGYQVIEASDGRAGVEAALQYDGTIDLLFTDVVMPHLNGFELAEQIQKTRPNINVLYTSGYAENDMAPEGFGQDEIEFISKPYTPEALAECIKAVLRP